MSKSKKRSNLETETSISVETVNQQDSSEIISKKSKKLVVESVKSIEDALKSIKKILQVIPDQKNLTLKQVQSWCKERSISIPWPAKMSPSKAFIESSAAKELSFDFEAPQSVAIAGSFMLQSFLSNEDTNVDMIVEQPEGIIFRYADGAKDHINWKYWLRRTFYLVVCYDALKTSLPASASCTFDHLNGNPYKTVICIKFEGLDKVIRVIPSIPFSEAFKAKMFRLAPQRSNVRPSWFDSWVNGSDSAAYDKNAKEISTPYYNYSLLSEALYIPHLVHLHSVLKASPVLAAAIKMIKAWLKQSGISSITSINGFVASMWLVDMLHLGIVNPDIMDELQIFKLVLKSWIGAFGTNATEFSRKLSGFGVEKDCEEFVDADKLSTSNICISLLAGPMNLLYTANMNSLQNLAQLASSTLAFLSVHPDRLDRIFLSKLGLELFTEDLVVDYNGIKISDIKGLPAGVNENYGNVMISGYLEGRISLVLRKGLTDRFKGPLNIKVIKAASDGIFNIRIGLTFDPQNFDRIVDLGPIAEDKEASAKFRGFWGSKSELRQFKDSAIRECVPWDKVKYRAKIPREIIIWLMSRHFSLVSSSDNADILDFVNPAGDAFNSFTGAFEALTRELRGLSQVLPLTIVQCVGLSPAHRHTALQSPEPRASLDQVQPSSFLPAPPCPVYDFLIRFERSSAWPDERQALQAARQAFLLQLNRTLRSRNIVEGTLVSSEFIDIFYKGYVFRGWIEVPREELRCRVEGLISEAERIEKRNFWQTCLSNSIHHLATRYRAFSETVRLVKNFFAGHLITLEDDLVDSLVALVFLEGEDQRGSGKASWVGSLLQNRPAGTGFTGFLRFLDLLVNFPWSDRPLILDLSALEAIDERIAPTDIEAMKSADWSAFIRSSSATSAISIVPIFNFEQKAMILNAIGNANLSDSIPCLPLNSLEKGLLIRCKLLAKLTLEHLEASPSFSSFNLQGLFKIGAEAICNDYDVLVRLDQQQLQLVPNHHIEGLTRILRNASQASPFLFSRLPGFSAVSRIVSDLTTPLKSLNATLSYNPTTPIMLAIRTRDASKIDEIVQTVKRIGGDLISDVKITRK